jgi:hypothetical protein
MGIVSICALICKRAALMKSIFLFKNPPESLGRIADADAQIVHVDKMSEYRLNPAIKKRSGTLESASMGIEARKIRESRAYRL